MKHRKAFTPDMLAERWQCSSETVRQMIKRGELQGFRVGRMFRITADSVDAFEEGRHSSGES